MASTSFLFCISGLAVLAAMVLWALSVRIVREDRRLSVYRLGRYLGDKGPGVVFLIPIIDQGVIKELGAVEKVPGQGLVGETGETRTTVFMDGKVFLAGQEWDAMSRSTISAGQQVRVVKIILEVEKS